MVRFASYSEDDGMVYGAGATADEARQDAADWFPGDIGDLATMECTKALYDAIAAEGAVPYEITVGGVACTAAEYDEEAAEFDHL